MTSKYEVLVELKPEVLDTEGRAILDALHRLGHDSVKNIRVSKRFVVDFESSCEQHEAQINSISKNILANQVSQTVTIRKKSDNDRVD